MGQNILALTPEVLAVALEDGVGEDGRGVGVEEGGSESEDVFPEPDSFPHEHEEEEGKSPKGEC